MARHVGEQVVGGRVGQRNCVLRTHAVQSAAGNPACQRTRGRVTRAESLCIVAETNSVPLPECIAHRQRTQLIL